MCISVADVDGQRDEQNTDCTESEGELKERAPVTRLKFKRPLCAALWWPFVTRAHASVHARGKILPHSCRFNTIKFYSLPSEFQTLAAGTDTNQRVGGWPWTMSVRADVYGSSLFTESSGHGEKGGWWWSYTALDHAQSHMSGAVKVYKANANANDCRRHNRSASFQLRKLNSKSAFPKCP